MSLEAAIDCAAAAQYLDDFKRYAAKTKEWQAAGNASMAALFRTYVLHAGRRWLALIGSGAQLPPSPEGQRDYANRVVREARERGLRVVTNIEP